jgi:hypothetical protein
MEGRRITAEELETQLQADVKVLAEEIAAAINQARAGRIIADSEERVRDAHAVFRLVTGRQMGARMRTQ